MANRKVDLSIGYREGDDVYGPGEGIEVPERVYELLKERGAFGEEVVDEGTPVEVLDSVDPGLASELRALGFGTVEELSRATNQEMKKANSVDAEKLKEILQELKARD